MAVLKANGSFLKANGKILVMPEGGGDFVVIGGRAYPFVRIGNQLWMAENLALETSVFYYPNNNSANKDDYGLLYPYKIVNDEIVPILPTGWRLPHKSDFDLLKSLNSNPSDWISTLSGGNNSFGINIPLAGWRDYEGFFKAFGISAALWTDTYYGIYLNIPRNYGLYVKLNELNTDDYNAASTTTLFNTAVSIRLVKDAT